MSKQSTPIVALDSIHLLSGSDVEEDLCPHGDGQVAWMFGLHHLAILASLLLMASMALFGCGGGYPGLGIGSLTAAATTIDAGQSVSITAVLQGTVPTAWSIVTTNCGGVGCGTLSAASGTTVTYTAPIAVEAPMQIVVQALAAGTTSGKVVTITVNPDPAIAGAPQAGVVGVAYSAKLTASGGTGALTLSVNAGSLPPGLTLNAATGTISGTPTAVGNYTFVAQVVDSGTMPYAATTSETIAVTAAGAPLTILGGNPPSGTVGVAYSTALVASGGMQPYAWSLVGGTLPAGLTLSATTGIISGIPAAQGTYSFTAQVQDANGAKAMAAFSITIKASGGTGTPIVISVGTLPNGAVNVPYSATIGVSGGTAPYSCTVTAGSLPAGLTLGANCVVSGTPTVAGTANLTVKASDSSSPVQTTSGPVSLTISPAALAITTGTLPNGTVGTPYSSTINVSGGTAPYSCVVVTGILPAGLSLGVNCLVSGTPTVAGTSNLIVKATDASNPVLATNGPVSITISPAALALATGTLPNGTVGTPYSSTIGVTGGAAPYSCALVSGMLQAGLTLGANCLVSGTPTSPGTVNLMIKATDTSNPAQTTTGPVSLTINAAPATLTLTSPPAGTLGVAYDGPIAVAGGTAPYTCTLVSGTLEAGLTLGSNCHVSGTPTASGSSNVMVKATDSAAPVNTTTGSVTVTINPANPTLVLASPPSGTVGVPYSAPVSVTGGTGPYTCSLQSGTLPAGLALGANCQITGTPTTSGATTVTVKATDSSSPSNSNTGSVTVTINPATVISVGNPPAATVGAPYMSPLPIVGGTAPYTCSLAGGTLPAGLTLAPNCVIGGTPTGTPGMSPITVMIADSGNPKNTTTAPVTITVQPPAKLTLSGTLPNAVLNQPYTQTLQATGGVAPYTYAVTAGTLPAGLTLSTGGVISGTPTAPGASAFTVTATDTEGTPQTANLPLTLLVVYATMADDGLLQGPYAFLFQGYDDVVAGVLAYQTATVGSFTADGTGVVTAGEQDANHQAANPAGTTVTTTKVLGTYILGADNRGSLTLTTFNADSSVARTTTYAISVKAPVAPATVATRGSLIEFDSNALVGTRGSGTFLAQTAASFATGLTGSYAFGLSGDTPCLPACTVGVVAGPAAAVGAFTTGAGAISNGTGDANIASTNYANSALTGSYGAADGSGRVQLSLTTSNMPSGVYPTDFAVYMVNANQAFVMSTDKHSAYVLLAGSATSQTQAAFSNASLSGGYVGYENSPTNPGIAGATLQNVLNLSTATIFRGTADGAGTCTTTNVDQGGTTALVNGVTGLGSGSNVINALLGTYASTGNSACTVAASGRGVLNYPVPSTLLTSTLTLLGLPVTPPPARVVYLTAPDTGYFLETGYAGLGNIEAQTGSPFSMATLKGTFVYGTTPAASLASTNSSGVFTADGAGHAATTLDMNVGVGTLNALQLGVSGNFNYVLTDATAGRFFLGASTVIYAISPGRFVLLDTNALTTSPSVALIY